MKGYKNPYLKIDEMELWTSSVYELYKNGRPFILKAMLTGFKVDKPIRIGAFLIRKYDDKTDNKLGTWSPNKSVLEFKYLDDKKHNNPVSMYVEPYYIFSAFFQVLQLMIDSWVGMGLIYYFDEKNKIVGTFGSYSTGVADSSHGYVEPTSRSVNLKRVKHLLAAQRGKFSMSIDRYSKGISEIMDEAIVDFVIVLESLLGYKLRSSIAHRLAVRGSIILAKNDLEKEMYYYALKYYYSLRSNIVHGETDEIYSPTGLEKKALEFFRVNLKDSTTFLKYHISEFARQLTSRILIFFIDNEEKITNAWLLRLELGASKKFTS